MSVAIIAALVAVAGCAGSNSNVALPPVSPTPTATPAVQISGLPPTFVVGQSTRVVATLAGYSGPFTFVSGDGAVVGLAAATSTSIARRTTAAPVTLVSINGVAIVVPESPGTTTLTLYASGTAGTGVSTSISITVMSATPSPSPSGSPGPTPVPSGSPGPTPSPTLAPGPTPTPTLPPGPTPAPTLPPGPTPAPTPTTAPSPTPTPTPKPGPLSASPSSLSIFGTGSAFAQTTVVSEPGYTGVVTETDDCRPIGGAIATVSPSSASGPSVIFTVTGVNAGNCSLTFRDANGAQATVPVTVSTLGIGVNAGRPR